MDLQKRDCLGLNSGQNIAGNLDFGSEIIYFQKYSLELESRQEIKIDIRGS